jgi:hypothetical protein
VLDVVGHVDHEGLELTWSYSHNLHHRTTIATLAHRMAQALREIVQHCAQPGAGGATPSDFPLVRLDQPTVDALVGDGRNIDDIYPLTPMQAGMVFHSLVDDASGAYLDQRCLRLSGVSDPVALASAWQQVVDRTPVLRSRVVWDGVPEPLLLVQRQVSLPITHHDWRELPEQARQHHRDQLLATDLSAGMDLDCAPLLRLAIARITDDEVLLIWTFHHVILDGWSVAQILGEVCEHYAALVEGRAAELVARRPVRDYLHWLAAQDQHHAEHYWRQRLAGFASPTPLPYDRAPIEAHRTESAQSVSLQLTVAESARLREVAQRNGLTVNTVVQGAWALLLSRYSGQREVVFGTTVSGRPAELAGVEDMIGMFINTIPTRITLPDDQSVISWLQQLQAAQVESRRFDFVSLTQLQAWSDLPAATNLFNSAVIFENYPVDQQGIADNGLHIDEAKAVDTTNFALAVGVFPEEQLSIDLGYDAALFDAATIGRMITYLRRLVVGIAQDVDRPVGQLPWLSDAERDQILVDWNDTGRDLTPATVPELFTAQVARTPEATALVCGAGRPSQSTGPVVDRPGCRPGTTDRAGAAAVGGPDRRGAGGPQGRRGLCAD